MKCNACGVELEAGSKKCHSCGAKQTVKNSKKTKDNQVVVPVKTMLFVLAGILLVGGIGLGLLTYQVGKSSSPKQVEVPAESYRYEIAVQAFESGNYEIAIEEMKKVAELSDDEGLVRQALHTIGMSQYFTGQYEEAIQSFNQAQDIALSFHTSVYMGDAYTQLGNQVEAFRWLKQANEIEPEEFLYHEFMAFFHYKFVDFESMIIEIDNAINLGSDNLYLYELKTIAYHLSANDALRDETLAILERSEYIGLDSLYKRLGLSRDYLFEKVSFSDLQLSFFEGASSVETTVIDTTNEFSKDTSRYIYWNLNYEVAPLKNPHPMLLRVVYKNESGEMLSDISDYFTIDKEIIDGSFFWGIGSDDPAWKVGTYQVEVFIEGASVSNGEFKITE
jgi:hypothetical protein